MLLPESRRSSQEVSPFRHQIWKTITQMGLVAPTSTSLRPCKTIVEVKSLSLPLAPVHISQTWGPLWDDHRLIRVLCSLCLAFTAAMQVVASLTHRKYWLMAGRVPKLATSRLTNEKYQTRGNWSTIFCAKTPEEHTMRRWLERRPRIARCIFRKSWLNNSLTKTQARHSICACRLACSQRKILLLKEVAP